MKITITKSKHTLPILIAFPILFLTAAHFLGKKAGNDSGIAAMERLRLVWPNVSEMDEVDRRLLAVLSLSCKLEEEPLERDATIACLRRAATNPLESIPEGRDGLPGPAALEVMLNKGS